jgi:hypothetical protein
MKTLLILAIFTFVFNGSFSQTTNADPNTKPCPDKGRALLTHADSMLVQNVKNFVGREAGFTLAKTFYTAWSKSEKPTVVVYVSLCDKVRSIDDKVSRYFGVDEDVAKTTAGLHESAGHHVFIYKTYATSVAELNNQFISYSNEAKCFILFHEFIHHFRRDLRLAVPYEYEEALGDVVGNYGAMEFHKEFGSLDSKRLRSQRLLNEKIYKIINKTSVTIDRKPEEADVLNSKCQKRIEKLLMDGNSFQKDRFAYHVNNAYLLKNRYYSEKYFLLQRLFQKSGTLSNFLNIFKNCPQDRKGFESYLNNFL